MKREKAQISLEFVLVIGLAVIMAIIVFPYITTQNELNKAVAAARDGATFGASMRGVGFTPGGDNPVPEGVVRVVELKLVDKSNDLSVEEKKNVSTWYQIRIQISAPDYIIDNPSCYSSSIGATVRNQALKYIYYAFNGEWPSTGIVPNVYTSNYKFTASCDFV